jgi:xylulokinase
LTPGTPIVTGAADTACSALGAGMVDEGRLLLTLSTGGQLIQPVEGVRVDLRGRIHTFCSALEPAPGQAGWYQMGAMLAAGLALRWLRDQVFGWRDEDAYARMNQVGEGSPPGANGLLFLPYLAGERTPHMDPTARAVFFGLTLQHGQGDLVRAVMEGVAFGACDAYDVLRELGAQAETVILAGGGARSALWRQIVADVFGKPVQVLETVEQSARGAALLAGGGAGLFATAAAAREWAAYGPATAPDMGRHHFYQGRFAEFRALYARNRGHFVNIL